MIAERRRFGSLVLGLRVANGLTAKQHAFVAAFIGESRGNATDAARRAGYHGNGKTLSAIGLENLEKPGIKEAVQEWRDEIKSSGIASLEYRVASLDDMEQRYRRLIEARRDAYTDTDVIGGDTGLVVKQYKMVGGGENAQLVEEYVADTAVTKEIRAIYDDVAKELGQRVDNLNVSGNLKREYVIVRPDSTTEIAD
jgi:phage terminase small subunit